MIRSVSSDTYIHLGGEPDREEPEPRYHCPYKSTHIIKLARGVNVCGTADELRAYAAALQAVVVNL